MSNSCPSTLEDAIWQSGEGWLIKWFEPRENAMDYIRQTLEEVQQVAQERLGDDAPNFEEASLLNEYNRNPHRMRAFFQILGGVRTPEMLLMAWRIIQGLEVKNIRLNYHKQETFEVQVILESSYGDEDPPYRSNNIHDFSVFHHIGFLEIGGGPVFDGFYPLNIPKMWDDRVESKRK